MSREEASMPAKLFRLLNDMSDRIPVAIITTKDLGFVKKRVPFAHAFSSICGLELQIGDTLCVDKRAMKKVALVNMAYREGLRVAEMHNDIILEKKTTSDGDLLAFCVDWRMSRNWADSRRIVKPFLTHCRELGLYVAELDYNPFVDVYVIKVDKGTAFVKLKSELGLSGPIMYLGDSEFDNPAFGLADVPIGITHRGISHNLLIKYHMEFDKLEAFFSSLLASNLDFVPSMVKE